eukprot:Gb_41453 [translate_table: standard]
MVVPRWWTKDTVAVVTGANKGIGLEIVRQLAQKGFTVILTARNKERGIAALKSLDEEGLQNVVFHELDVKSSESASCLAEWLRETFDGIDILINNAAVNGMKPDFEYFENHEIPFLEALRDDSITEGFPVDVETVTDCMETNYHGVKRVTAALLPLLRPGSRIINVSSTFGALKEVKNSTLRQKLSEVETLTEEFVDDFVGRYVKDVESGNVENKGWPEKFAAYKLSKVALNAYSRVLARKLSILQTRNGHKIYLNCVHPGYIKSDLVFNAGGVEAAEGAMNVVRIALLPPDEIPSG